MADVSTEYDDQSAGLQASSGQMAQSARPSWDDTPQVDPGREKLVKKWCDKIHRAEKFWAKTFKRMKQCRQLARDGADKDWLDGNNYVVPLIPRHINAMVSALYAKDPRAEAKPRKKLLYTVWDGTEASLKAAIQTQQASAQQAMAGNPVGVSLPQAINPGAQAILNEIQQAKIYQTQMARLAKTMVLCWEYFTGEQKANFKLQMKALVRRTKINGVGYVKLGYQRILKKNPEITAGIQDITSKIADIQARLTLAGEDAPGFEEDSANLETLKLSLADLQNQETIVVREGPIFDFPRSDEIIIDPKVRHLKTFTGAGWYAHNLGNFTQEEVLKTYNVDLKNSFTRYLPSDTAPGAEKMDDSCCRLYEVWDIETQMTFVVCDGYPDFIKPPARPDVNIERFWTIFPLVFNEVESDDGEVYPPSDVWMMRHPQFEYNRARQGLREHRNANRPKYATVRGTLEETDIQKLTSAPAHSVVELNGMATGEKIEDKVQRIPMIGIDPNQYQVEEHYKDTLRAVGSQEADMGAVSGGTATESSIAEQSHQSGIADQIDELDDFLSELAHATGQLMLSELSIDTVKEIAGPGAVWPDHPLKRDEVAKDMLLTIRAGSSGRPNQAAEIAKMERAAPYLIQIPGINPEPLADKFAQWLDMDLDQLYTAGIPSITAQNAIQTSLFGNQTLPVTQPGTGNPETNPADQGPAGADNVKNPQDNEPASQPAYPAPGDTGLQAM